MAFVHLHKHRNYLTPANHTPRVLIVSEDAAYRKRLGAEAQENGFAPTMVSSVEEAYEMMHAARAAHDPIDLLLFPSQVFYDKKTAAQYKGKPAWEVDQHKTGAHNFMFSYIQTGKKTPQDRDVLLDTPHVYCLADEICDEDRINQLAQQIGERWKGVHYITDAKLDVTPLDSAALAREVFQPAYRTAKGGIER